MRPNAAMARTCRQALAWFDDHPEARSLVEGWQLRFARSVTSDKVFATVARLGEWLDDHDHYRGTPGFFATSNPSAERVAWDMVGGDAAVLWAREALTSIPVEEHSMITDSYDALEREADERERVAAFASRQTMRLDDWADPGAFASFEGRRPEWSGVLCFEGVATSDNRFIMEGALGWRELPLSLQDQIQSAGGHDGAVAVGPITNIYRVERDGGGNAIVGEGMFDTGQDGQDARRRMSEGTKQGVSVDLTEVELELPEDPDEAMEVLMGDGQLRISSARIGAATLVTIPAFEGARLQITGDVPDTVEPIAALVASGGRLEGVTLRAIVPMEFAIPAWVTDAPVEEVDVTACEEFTDDKVGVLCSQCGQAWGAHELAADEPCDEFEAGDDNDRVCATCGFRDYRHKKKMAAGEVEEFATGGELTPGTIILTGYGSDDDALVASGGLRPPALWFDAGVYSGVRPVTIEDPDENGLRRIHGHVAAWGSCHIGFAGRCVDVPRGLDYASFQGERVPGSVQCADGSMVKAGPVVMDTVHPSLKAKASDAAAHYADTGSIAAQVRLFEDKHGLQMQGWVMPGLSEEHMARLRASDFSPDWRPRATANGGRGVVAVLAVPVSGFNLGLVASAGEMDGDVEEMAIIGTSWTPHAAALAGRKAEALRRLSLPVSDALEALAASIEPPEVSARKAAVLARLAAPSGSCGCGGECCQMPGD